MRSSSGKAATFVFVVLHLMVFILNSSKITTAQEVENEEEFSYVEGSNNGPDRWGDLHRNWTTCKVGRKQSPIDIQYERVDFAPDLGKLRTNYRTSNATLQNRGHDISLQWVIGTAGSILIDGTIYALEQLHWHSPSEHAINGKRFALELHMVHRNVQLQKIAVVAIMYSLGRPDKFLSELEKQIECISDTNKQLNVGMINPKRIKLGGIKYFRYVGSLTTPPCTEGVTWTINERVRTVSAEQIQLLKTAVHDGAECNSRPLQPFNNRDILLYSPEAPLSDLYSSI